MNLSYFVRSIFRVREYANFPAVAPPAYAISGLLIFTGMAAYFMGGLSVESTLRYSSLATSTFGIIILLFHFLNPALARWSAGLLTSLLVFVLAGIWQDPQILFLLIIPVLITAVLINLPALLLTTLLHTVFIISTQTGLEQSTQTILLLSLWLSALTVGGGYFYIERLLARASEDYSRLQDLLDQSRDQQQRLSFALEDLEHANRQLSLLYGKNITLRKSAEEATEAKSTYIARVSHEIRTPLNMILGITESVIENQESYEDELPLDLVDDIKVIRRNSEHLLSLVNDVLDLTRAETSRMILRKEWIDIDQEIEKSIEIVQPLAKKKKLSLGFAKQPGLPQVYCDRTRIRQVILNLLSNAIRYTDHGEVKIEVNADNNWLFVAIKDTGPGIESGDLEKIFEPFYRGTTSIRQETVGTGLGLSVCRQLVDLHGGKIWLESQTGQGSSFFFRLPVTLNSEPAASPVRYINEQWVWVERKRERLYNYQTPEKKRVIIWGYNELIAPNASAIQDQVEIIPVETIPDMADKVSTIPAHLVVVNTDQLGDLMPAMQEAASLIQDTPIIGSVFSALHEQVQKAGAIDYVQKPFSNQRLRQAVEQIVPYPRKILVVDDNAEMQRLMVRILSAHSETTQYLLAENGIAALEVARRKKPDLVLLDLALPEMDGWQVLKSIKEDKYLCEIPVILVSAHDLNETPVRSKAVVLMNGEGISLEKFHNLLETGIFS